MACFQDIPQSGLTVQPCGSSREIHQSHHRGSSGAPMEAESGLGMQTLRDKIHPCAHTPKAKSNPSVGDFAKNRRQGPRVPRHRSCMSTAALQADLHLGDSVAPCALSSSKTAVLHSEDTGQPTKAFLLPTVVSANYALRRPAGRRCVSTKGSVVCLPLPPNKNGNKKK